MGRGRARKCTSWGFFIHSRYILAILGDIVQAGNSLFSAGTFLPFWAKMYRCLHLYEAVACEIATSCPSLGTQAKENGGKGSGASMPRLPATHGCPLSHHNRLMNMPSRNLHTTIAVSTTVQVSLRWCQVRHRQAIRFVSTGAM